MWRNGADDANVVLRANQQPNPPSTTANKYGMRYPIERLAMDMVAGKPPPTSYRSPLLRTGSIDPLYPEACTVGSV